MKLINGILYLTWAESLINEATLYKARERNSSGYVFDSCPVQGNLVQYDSLKAEHKLALVQSGKYGTDLYTWYYAEGFEIHLQRDPKAKEYYRGYRYGNNKALPNEVIEQYSRFAEVMNLLSTARYMLAEAMKYLQAKGIANIKNTESMGKKLRAYITQGYGALISGKWGNQCAVKIEGPAADWLVAQYALPTKMQIPALHAIYMVEAKAQGWPALSESGIEQYLTRPEVESLWYLGRNGQQAWLLKYGQQQKIKRATAPHRLWLSDGTGFNYQFSDSKMGRIYWVMDDHSECILGWAWDMSEHHQVVFRAYKEAAKFAGYRPEEIRYDNGSANKKLMGFFSQLATLTHKPSAPYRGSGKTIEPLTLRFQKQIMRKWWFFTGQNRSAHTMDSKQNAEFVLRHKHELPTLEEGLAVFAADVQEWNNAKHHKYNVPRIEVLREGINENAVAINPLDMVELFWTSAERTYTARGVQIDIGKNSYEFEVYNEQGLACVLFRAQHIGKRFTVRYDPDDLSYVMLYEATPSGEKLVGKADSKIETHYAAADHTEGEGAKIRRLQKHGRDELAIRQQQLQELQARTGIDEDSLVRMQNERIKKMTLANHYRQDDDLDGSTDDITTPYGHQQTETVTIRRFT